MEKDLAKANESTAPKGEVEKQDVELESSAAKEGSDRLLNESKKHKEAAQLAKKEAAELRAKLESIEKAKAEEQGKYKELFEKSEASRQEMMQKVAKATIKSKIGELATKKGCQNLDALLKLGNSSLLEFDIDSGEVNGADLYIEDAMKNFDFLFSSKKQLTVNGATPGGAAPTKKITKLSDLSVNDRNKLWESALKKAEKQ